jgi:hypothetical protein
MITPARDHVLCCGGAFRLKSVVSFGVTVECWAVYAQRNRGGLPPGEGVVTLHPGRGFPVDAPPARPDPGEITAAVAELGCGLAE